MITPSIVASDCVGADCGGLHETEVEHLDEILSAPDPPEVNVGRLDVSMDETSCVRLFE